MGISIVYFISLASTMIWAILIGLGGISLSEPSHVPGFITFIIDNSSILLAVVFIMNILGLVLAFISHETEKNMTKEKKTLLIVAVILNAIPLLIVAGAFINDLFQTYIAS